MTGVVNLGRVCQLCGRRAMERRQRQKLMRRRGPDRLGRTGRGAPARSRKATKGELPWVKELRPQNARRERSRRVQGTSARLLRRPRSKKETRRKRGVLYLLRRQQRRRVQVGRDQGSDRSEKKMKAIDRGETGKTRWREPLDRDRR